MYYIKVVEIKNIKNVTPTEPYDFYIDRRSPVGSPFFINKFNTRKDVCIRYRA